VTFVCGDVTMSSLLILRMHSGSALVWFNQLVKLWMQTPQTLCCGRGQVW